VRNYEDIARYNQDLSLRRARAVAEELVRDGIAPSEIATRGFSETHPLVPTAPGMREPQNRRVEIIHQ
jgi:outer membrane protein OmpA-like peptidoglycan-associated protein